jgi:hypothetical protein
VIGLAPFASEAVLRASVGGPALALPSVWLALLTEQPDPAGVTGGGTLPEATFEGYARTELPYDAGAWVLGGAGTLLSNTVTIEGPTCTGGSEMIVAWALCDDEGIGQGNVVWVGGMPPIVVTTADPQLRVPPGMLILNLARA